KVKTWTQMQGIGVMLLFPLLGEGGRTFLTWFLGVLVVGPIAIALVLWVVRKKFWRGAIIMSASVAPIFALHLYGDMQLTIRWIMFAVVAITWISGIDYIVVGWKQLRGRGDFTRADAVRLVGSISLPILLFAVLVETDAPPWPVFTILAVELAV